jgi:hypothetical protein
LRTETALAHLLDRYQSTAEFRVFCLVNGTHPSLSHLAGNQITRIEEMVNRKKSSSIAYNYFLGRCL